MGLLDWINGRTDKQRAKRAEKIRQTFGSDTELSPAMLEALTRANDVPNEPKIALYKEAVPAGAEPTRVSVGYQVEEGIHQVAVLFPDGLSILSQKRGKQKNGEPHPIAGAQVPFWGIQSVEVRTLQNADTALLVSGSDGNRPYRLGYVLTDAAEIKSLAEDIEAGRQADARSQAEAQSQTDQPRVNIDSSLSADEQLTALRQMREMTNMPDDAYEAAVRRIKESQTTSE